jgi:hypothetical protein
MVSIMLLPHITGLIGLFESWMAVETGIRLTINLKAISPQVKRKTEIPSPSSAENTFHLPEDAS